uniref:Uncharacterized protein n=1 Tax=Rhizophora mucronata TaxID=61149 RepID=A0A2P2ITN4_RHIMU
MCILAIVLFMKLLCILLVCQSVWQGKSLLHCCAVNDCALAILMEMSYP